MIKRAVIKKIVSEYSGIKIGVLGSHSALEVLDVLFLLFLKDSIDFFYCFFLLLEIMLCFQRLGL